MVPDPLTEVARGIELAVRASLAQRGLAATVLVRGDQIELHARGAPVSIGLDHLVEQWGVLPEDIRQRKIADVTRRLIDAQRAGGHAPPERTRSLPGTGLLVGVGATVLVVLGLVAFAVLRRAGNDERLAVTLAAEAGAPVETGEEARSRHARVCEAGRKRVYAGASIGPFDTEGWYAELWLAKKGGAPLEQSPELAAWTAPGGKLAAAADPELAAVPDGAVELVPGFAPDRAARAAGYQAVTIRFSGRYAGAYLDAALRPRFLALAERLAAGSGAEVGSLYGRCAHLRFHDLGAWFRGADAAAAAASLAYSVGLFTELAAVDRSALEAAGENDLDVMRERGAKLDALTLGSLVGAQGGNVTTGADGAVVLSFPLAGGTRANSASRIVARRLGVGVQTD